MKPFRWGNFDELVEASGLDDCEPELLRDRTGLELGRLVLPPQVGEGTLEYLCSDSLRVVVFDCRFVDQQVFNIFDDGWLRLNFGVNLALEMTFGDQLPIQANEPAWRFIHLPDDQQSVETLPAAKRLQWVTVCCRPALLRELTGVTTEELSSPTDPYDNSQIVHRCFALTPLLQSAAAGMFERGMSGRLRVPYVATKAHELLVLGIDQMLRVREQPVEPVRLSERDCRALHAIRAFVDANLTELPTTRALSSLAGMNRTKLQYGFRRLFGMTLSEHVQERRVEEGYRLLTTTDAPIGEIAAKVGFRHPCNFATALKARYGCAPVALRRQVPR